MIMFNYLFYLLLNYLLNGLIKVEGMEFVMFSFVVIMYLLNFVEIFGFVGIGFLDWGLVNFVLIVVLIVCVLVWVLIWWICFGYEIWLFG